ncbi:MAG: molybdenum cofactor guanylyltransferase [Granulosicoccus sp.]|nr:molybdenum cofactor guanylyltransferase [Granulosicoccus sp.]
MTNSAVNSVADTGAVILAGGLARRMQGRDKGLILLGETPLVKWVADCVDPQVDELIINANRNQVQYQQFGFPVVNDSKEGHLGPLAGLLTGMQTLTQSRIFMCPCDSPFVPEDMVGRLAQALEQGRADIAVAHDGERMQPVFCLARKSLQTSLLQFLDSGERKIDRWFAAEKMVTVDFADEPTAFLNINTEEERVAVEQSLAVGSADGEG